MNTGPGAQEDKEGLCLASRSSYSCMMSSGFTHISLEESVAGFPKAVDIPKSVLMTLAYLWMNCLSRFSRACSLHTTLIYKNGIIIY